MRIQHNIMAMNAYRNFVGNNNSLSRNLEKLSSGYRINRAGDDAAGLAISEKMRAQITGLDTAQKNVKDGISLVKTAEGALQEVQDMMNRMVSLATQSANGTYDDGVDRQALQDEMDALLEEINRISDTANFNGIKLLDGSLGTQVKAPTEAALAVSQITTSSVNGVAPSAAEAAQYEFTLGGVNGGTETLTADTTDGVHASQGEKATLSLTLGAEDKIVITNDNSDTIAVDKNTTYQQLSDFVIDHANNLKMGDIFDFSAYNSTMSNAIGENTLNLTAKNHSQLNSTIEETLTNGLVPTEVSTPGSIDCSGNFVNGRDDGTAGNSVTTKYEFTIDTAKLHDGDFISLNEKTYTFDFDAEDTGAANGTIGFAGGDTRAQAAIKKELDADLSGTHNVSVTVASTGKLKVTIEAKDGGVAGNLGDITKNFADDTAYDAETIRLGKEAPDAQPATFAKAEYDLDATEFAKVGAKLEINGKTIEVVENGSTGANAVDGTGNTYKLSVGNANAAGLQSALEQLGFAFDKVSFAGNKLTITDTVEGRAGTALTGDIGTVQFTKVGVNGKADHTTNTLDIEANVTSYSDLANMVVDGQKIGDLFTIKVNDSEVTIDGTKIANGDKITLVAKNPGAMDAEVAAALKAYDTDGVAGADVTADDGKATGADNAGTSASIAYSLTGDFRAGDTITIGDKTVEIVADGETDAAAGKFSVADATDAALSTYFSDNTDATVTFSSGTVTIAKDTKDTDTAADMVTNFGMSVTSDRSDTIQNAGLTLQIGDSADEELVVSINDMGTDGLEINGLKGIGIKSRTAAKEAIDTLKTAINTVSSQRGRLGAIQNRLEHTSNNLSVMEENITDAESTIRDTDMADEMTAYTKNNILVQAAQAMLAQANQQPQGVLQLLQ